VGEASLEFGFSFDLVIFWKPVFIHYLLSSFGGNLLNLTLLDGFHSVPQFDSILGDFTNF